MKPHFRLDAKDSCKCLDHSFLRNGAVGVCLKHSVEVLGGIVEEEEHIAARIDAKRQHFLASHSVGHSDHVAGVGNYHAVKSKLVTEKPGHNLLAQGSGKHLFILDAGVIFSHIRGHHNVTTHNSIKTAVDQGFVNMTVSLHPLLFAKVVDIIGKVGISEVKAVAREMLCNAGKSINGVKTVHISLAHFSNSVNIITKRS